MDETANPGAVLALTSEDAVMMLAHMDMLPPAPSIERLTHRERLRALLCAFADRRVEGLVHPDQMPTAQRRLAWFRVDVNLAPAGNEITEPHHRQLVGSYSACMVHSPADGHGLLEKQAKAMFREGFLLGDAQQFEIFARPVTDPSAVARLPRLGITRATDTHARVIPAEVYSDDRRHHVKFDAEAWFLQAEDWEIQLLVKYEFGHDVMVEPVALWMATWRPDIAALLEHARDTRHYGFEVEIAKEPALAWLAQKRPHLVPNGDTDKDEVSPPTP